MFLSLHVEFMRSQAILMHDRLQALVGVVAISFTEVGSLLFEFTKNFGKSEKKNEETFEGLVKPKLEGKTK